MRKRFYIILLCTGLCLGLWSFIIEPSSIIYKEQSLKVEGWPQELSGMKIALLTDIHIGSPFMTLERLREIHKNTSAYNPDMIMLGGDYVVDGVFGVVIGGEQIEPDHIFAELNTLSAPLGVFAVMGNHEWRFGYRKMVESFKSHAPDITLLEDEATIVEYGGQPFTILGISDFYWGPRRYRKALAEHSEYPVLALTHTPDVFAELPQEVILTLAGHTHGGQVYVPFLGRPIVPSEYGQRYVMGLVEEKGHSLFVSAGIGTSILGVRFLTPPEVNILTIFSK